MNVLIFNADLSSWNISSVTDICGMFYGCSSFNADISGWDISNVSNISNMFTGTPLTPIGDFSNIGQGIYNNWQILPNSFSLSTLANAGLNFA